MFRETGSDSLATVSCSEVGRGGKAGICVNRVGGGSGSGWISSKFENGGLDWGDNVGSTTFG